MDVLTGDIELRPATGREDLVALGWSELEHPLPGGVILAEGSTVLIRRWTWRQGNHTLALLETTAVEINVDGLPPVEAAELEAACAEVPGLVRRFCGREIRVGVLPEEHPRIRIAPWGGFEAAARQPAA